MNQEKILTQSHSENSEARRAGYRLQEENLKLHKKTESAVDGLKTQLPYSNRRTHGMSKTTEYVSYSKMIQRCTNPKENNYERYGGAGVLICDEWRHSFETFFRDMGKKPSRSHSIERIKNSEGYCKDNCKWADKVEQSSNRKSCRYITMNNKTMTLAAWCRELCLNYDVTRQRIAREGWSEKRALSTPTNKP